MIKEESRAAKTANGILLSLYKAVICGKLFSEFLSEYLVVATLYFFNEVVFAIYP